MKKILALILCMGFVLSLTACARVKADDLMSGIVPDKVETNVDLKNNTGLMDFAVELFKNAEENGENSLVSPFSVLCALAMTANGADKETLAQMEQALGMPIDELNEYIYAYTNSLAQGDKYKLSVANSIWFSDRADFVPNRDFLQTNANYYGAGIYKSDFSGSACDDINLWVKQNTNGMIDKIIDEIPEDAVMYLINALAFEAEWASIYERSDVNQGNFFKEDKTKQSADFMYAMEHSYLTDEKAKGFIKYYSGGEYAFAALLPDEGVSLSDYVDSLTGEKLAEILANKQSETVRTSIPKFKSECSFLLNDCLKDMGMTDAFSGSLADFSKLGSMDDNSGLYINRVLHKTYIEVAEKGTKAGAVTAVELNCEGAMILPEDIKEVYLNRPFVYMIIDTNANLPLFIGTVTEI